MFQRRKPYSFFQKLRQTLWPSMGWWRVVKYYRLRIVRMSSTAESISVNLAAGSAMSFTPFFGIHIFGAMGIAWLIGARMNIVAAMVGSFFGNPWTFPFILYASYRAGAWILTIFSAHDGSVGFNPDIASAQGENIFVFVWDNFSSIFVPTAIGGTILAILTFPLFYMFYVYLVRGAQRARKLRMRQKQRALFNKKSKGE